MDRLAASARALGQGQRIDPSPTGVTELDAVASALVDAERDLQRRERDRDQAQAQVRESEETLRLALAAGRLGAWDYDGSGRRFVLSDSGAAIFARSDGDPVDLAAMAARVHEEDRARFEDAIEAALAEGTEFEVSIRSEDAAGAYRWVDLRGRRVDRDGRIALVGVAQDVTDRHVAEERQRLLIHELNHRVKNTLATVQSIAFMTYRSAEDPETLWERFADRLNALAKTHDLLTAQDWTGADLGDVLAGELAPFQDESGRRISLSGVAISLSPHAVLALGLVFHELATNAVKYGSLSAAMGGVSATWSIAGAGPEARLVIEWVERGGPAVTPPTRKGFGSRLIERSVSQQLGGRLTLDYASGGLRCVMDLPFDDATAHWAGPLRPGVAHEIGAMTT